MGLVLLVAAALMAGQTNTDVVERMSDMREGKATRYSPGLMEKVAHKRGLTLAGASGFSTYPDCSAIGKFLLVQVLDPRTREWSRWRWKRIADCSQPADYARHVRSGLVELSYKDAQSYGYAYEGRTRIRFFPPVP